MREENKLINRAKSGESKAFGELYDKHLSAIYRYIFLRVGGRKADAEDLAHQVFLSAWQNIKNYEFRGFPFSSWLYRIAHNALIDHYRTEKIHLDIDKVPESILVDSENLEGVIDQNFELEKVKVVLQKLEPDQQNVLIMKFVNDLSNKEIAEVLEKSEGAIRVIQHRAIKRIKSLLSAQGGSASGGEKNGGEDITTTV